MREIQNDQPSGVPEPISAYLGRKISELTVGIERRSGEIEKIKSTKRRQNSAERLTRSEERLAQLRQMSGEIACGNYNGIQSVLDNDINLYNTAISWAQRKLETMLSDDDRFYSLQEKISRGEQIASQLQQPEDIQWVSAVVGKYRQSLEFTERVRTTSLLLDEQEALNDLQQLRALIPLQ